MKIFYRNGKGSAYCQIHHPELAYDTDENIEFNAKRARKSFIYRIFRFKLRQLRALFTGHFIRFAAYTAYATGYVIGYGIGPRENID